MASDFPPSIDEEIEAFADGAFDTLLGGGPPKGQSTSVELADADVMFVDDVDDVDDGQLLGVVSDDERENVERVTSESHNDHTQGTASLALDAQGLGVAAASLLGVAAGGSPSSDMPQARMSYSERPSMVGTNSTSREMLAMRERLNEKDKEILGLRDQLSSRDKLVLELRDRHLVLDRSRSDYEDKINELKRDLGRTSDALGQFQREQEAVNTRFEDAKSKLDRTESRRIQLEQDLGRERDEHATTLAKLKDEHFQAMSRIKAQHDEAVTALRRDGDAEETRLRKQFETKIEADTQTHETVVEELRRELNAQREEEVSATRDEGESRRQAALAALKDTLHRQFSERVDELRASHDLVLSSRETEVREERQRQLDELEGRHGQEITALGRRLAAGDTENQALVARAEKAEKQIEVFHSQLQEANDRITAMRATLDETVSTRDALRDDLRDMRDVRDTREAELRDARAEFSRLETRSAALNARVDELASIRRDAESKLAIARTKISTDGALLERVRKALAISTSLLHEQVSNHADDHESIAHAPRMTIPPGIPTGSQTSD